MTGPPDVTTVELLRLTMLRLSYAGWKPGGVTRPGPGFCILDAMFAVNGYNSRGEFVSAKNALVSVTIRNEKHWRFIHWNDSACRDVDQAITTIEDAILYLNTGVLR
jgi:hypothetical protein